MVFPRYIFIVFIVFCQCVSPRLLFVGISFILVNIWVNLLWLKISRKRKGRRLIYRRLFSLKQMLAFLRQAVEKIHEVIEHI